MMMIKVAIPLPLTDATCNIICCELTRTLEVAYERLGQAF